MDDHQHTQEVGTRVPITAVLVTVFCLLAVALVVGTGAMLVGFAPGTNDGAEEQVSSSGNEPDPAPGPTPTPAAETVAAEGDPPPEQAEPSEPDLTEAAGDEVSATIAHRIERGDTLIGLGDRYGTDWRLIAELNQITDPNLIGVGRVLQIPNPDAPADVELPSDTQVVGDLFVVHGEANSVPVELLQAVAWYESEWNPAKLGDSGEIGIGQLLPEVHAYVERDLAGGVLDASDLSQSIEAMALYLGWLLSETQGDTSATLAAYHQGLLSQRNIGWDSDTIDYIAEVVALRPQFVARDEA